MLNSGPTNTASPLYIVWAFKGIEKMATLEPTFAKGRERSVCVPLEEGKQKVIHRTSKCKQKKKRNALKREIKHGESVNKRVLETQYW
jgi:hypothetical protein